MLRIGTLRLGARTYATTVTPKAISLPLLAQYDPELDPQLAGLDYPLLSTASRQTRSPNVKWDDPQERSNFNEPVSRFFRTKHARGGFTLDSRWERTAGVYAQATTRN